MLNAVATANQFVTSEEFSTGLLLGSLTLIACLVSIILVMINPDIAASVAMMAMM